jgi:hypothetical protein
MNITMSDNRLAAKIAYTESGIEIEETGQLKGDGRPQGRW